MFTLDEASAFGGSRGMMVLLEKQVHLQNETGAVETLAMIFSLAVVLP